MTAHARWFRRRLLAVAWVVGAASVLVGLALVLSYRPPSWWIDPIALAGNPDSLDRGSALEQHIAATVSRVRLGGERWVLRIRDSDINAWLAARGPLWTAHDPSLPWPMAGAATQVRFVDGTATVAIEVGGRIWSGSCAISVAAGEISMSPQSGAIGQLPVPWGANLALGFLEGEGAQTLRLPRTFALGDGRTVEVLRVDLVSEAIEVECVTR